METKEEIKIKLLRKAFLMLKNVSLIFLGVYTVQFRSVRNQETIVASTTLIKKSHTAIMYKIDR